MEELPIPLSRVELYLAKAAGMDVTPPEPKSRLELFLAKIAGMDVETPLPLSLKEQWLSCVYYGTTSDHPMLEGAYYIDNQKVDVRYLAVASGVPGATLPAKPHNRKEQYWAMIAIHGPIHGVLKYVTGTNITLTDVVSGIEELQFVYGDTYQQTYSGKNKANFVGETKQGLTSVNNGDGTITISGTATASGGYEVMASSQTLPAGTYTLLISKALPFLINFSIASGVSFRIPDGSTSATATLSQDYDSGTLFMAMTSGTTYNETFGIQLVAGSDPDYDFEPYVGGEPAPNPDYPQDVQTVTGEQTVTVTGKNLFDKNNVNYYMGYFEGDLDNPSLVSGSTVRNRVIYIKCKPSTVYSISLTNRDSINSPQVGTTDSLPDTGLAVTKLGIFESGSLKLENLTTSATAQYIVIRFQTHPSAVRFDDISQALLDGLQIEQGSTATAYEPYQSQNYEINLGKNVFDKDNPNLFEGYFDGGVSNPSIIYISGNRNRVLWLECKPNTTYSISFENMDSLNPPQVGTTSKLPADGIAVSKLGNFSSGSMKLENLTTTSEARYLVIRFQTTAGSINIDGVLPTALSGLQIEKGPTATSYSPYFTPIELCKIGDCQDYIYRDEDGDWYVHKATGKMTSTSANLVQYQLNTYNKFTRPNNAIRSHPSVVTATSNMGVGVWQDQTWNSPIVGLFTHASGTDWWLGFGRVVTDEEAAEIIGKGCIIYYALATATNTKITDATLVGQLNAIDSAVLPKPIAHITVGATDSNLSAPIKISYYGRGA